MLHEQINAILHFQHVRVSIACNHGGSVQVCFGGCGVLPCLWCGGFGMAHCRAWQQTNADQASSSKADRRTSRTSRKCHAKPEGHVKGMKQRVRKQRHKPNSDSDSKLTLLRTQIPTDSKLAVQQTAQLQWRAELGARLSSSVKTTTSRHGHTRPQKRVLSFANSGSDLGLAKYWGIRACVRTRAEARPRAKPGRAMRQGGRALTQAINPVVIARVARLQRARMLMIEMYNAAACCMEALL